MRALATVAVVLAGVLAVLAATDTLPLENGDSGAGTPRPRVDRFDSAASWRLLERQVAMGPRPAGSAPSRRLARELRRALPGGRYQPVPGGLRNVVGVVPGRSPERVVVVGAHYDTKDMPGFVGANDGASGTAVVTQLARSIRPRRLRPTLVFVLFDGEESPRGTPDSRFLERGLRGSKVAARRWRDADAMILLDFVGERRLRLPRERYSDARLWARLRAAAGRVGAGGTFPPATRDGILDDHIPFRARGVPAVDLIDFDFDCFHRRCDDLSVVSERSLDAVGESLRELLSTL
jgi:glutaminyl-peptide cyclotransferase